MARFKVIGFILATVLTVGCKEQGFESKPLVPVCEGEACGVPTENKVPRPTATPKRTATPAPSATPAPTSTPVATATPAPTATPMATATPAPTATPQASINSARILFSGHSLLSWPVANFTDGAARSLGLSHKYQEQMRGGSSIKVRTRGSGAEGSASFPGYADPQNLDREWRPIDVLNELRTGASIGGDRYDTLVITERHDLMNVIFDQDSVRHLRHYHERMIAANPGSQTYFYAPWLSHKVDKIRAWISYEKTVHAGWDCVATRINHSLAAEGRADRVKGIPANLALADLVERAIGGSVPGVSGGTDRDVLARLFNDDVHLSTLGSYYISMVTLASVYRRSPVGSWRPPEVSAQQAETLQTLAWNFVSTYYASYTPRTLAQCQALMPDLCSAFWNFDWIYANRPDMVPSCQERLRRQDTSNPFHYSSSGDRNWWLPSPQ